MHLLKINTIGQDVWSGNQFMMPAFNHTITIQAMEVNAKSIIPRRGTGISVNDAMENPDFYTKELTENDAWNNLC